MENLKYLSSRQASEDIAYFIQFINKQNGWTNTKWVVFGGSYSGNKFWSEIFVKESGDCQGFVLFRKYERNLGALAAWFRQLHPELAAGAVGSSGPVQATVDFYRRLLKA